MWQTTLPPGCRLTFCSPAIDPECEVELKLAGLSSALDQSHCTVGEDKEGVLKVAREVWPAQGPP